MVASGPKRPSMYVTARNRPGSKCQVIGRGFVTKRVFLGRRGSCASVCQR